MAPVSLDWERHKETMRSLYVDRKMKLKDVMETMKGPPHHFSATIKQYERQFQTKWRFRKNLTKSDWKAICFMVCKRKRQGKKTNVRVDGRLLQLEKLAHERSRYGLSQSPSSETEPPIPNGLSLETPPPTPGSLADFPPEGVEAISLTRNPEEHLRLDPITRSSTSSWCSQMDGLPFSELLGLLNVNVEGPCDQLMSLEYAHLKSFIVLSDGAMESGQELDKATCAARRTSVLKATMPQSTHTMVSTTEWAHRIEDPSVTALAEAIYLLYNDLGSSELDTFMIQSLSISGNRRILDKLLSLPGTAVEAFAEKLFLAVLSAGKDSWAVELLQQGKVAPHALHLREAARTGCLRTVDALLERGIDPRARPVSRNPLFNINPTALDAAIASNQHAIVERLSAHLKRTKRLRIQWRPSNSTAGVSRSATSTDVRMKAPDGYPELVAAAWSGATDVVSSLLISGVPPKRPDTTNSHGSLPSALQAAIAGIILDDGNQRDLRVIGLLIDHGACPNEAPKEKGDIFDFENDDSNYLSSRCVPNRTAIQAAAEAGHHELFFYLLDRGADLNAPAAERHGLTAFQAALKSQCTILWQFFSDNIASLSLNYARTAHAGTTSLIEAVRARNLPAVRQLLEIGCDVNDTGTVESSRSALSEAILTEDMTLVELLLDAGADINHPQASRDGGTALQAALSVGNVELVYDLIEMGADVLDERALLIAVGKSPIRAINMLLSAIEAERRRNPTRTVGGQRALQLAICRQEDEILTKFMSLDIDPNEPATVFSDDECGHLGGCFNEKRFGSWLWIETICFSDDFRLRERALGTAIRLQNADTVKRLLESGADVEFPMESNRISPFSPLTGAAALGLLEVVQMLLEYGADINSPAAESFGRTALQAATESGHYDIVKLLLDKGADCNAKPAPLGGATALQLASIKGYIGIAQMLHLYGADPNAPAAEEQGRSALEGAAEHGRIDMLQFLFGIGASIGAPMSPSSRKIFSLAFRGGHMTVLKVLETHQADVWRGGLSGDHQGPENTNIMESWQYCGRCLWAYSSAEAEEHIH